MTAAPNPRPTSPSVNGWNAEYLESEYQRWKSDPNSLAPDLQQFFIGFDLALSAAAPRSAGVEPPSAGTAAPSATAVRDLIIAHRTHGHLAARTDPWGWRGRGQLIGSSAG